ncbi:DNA polymerase III subunit alpha [Petrotoga olearia]|uniref:DNA-directed DNA polymerase n=2 Tax=Petrotoga olearia TaxID=156203 RepID=A0A2K1P4M1_9BACT|nr:DNA polymerase III subunit alpha [Petrotoga olearia]PNR97728.1 hypothetical protein X929_02100 [Petrotoga olearia DSM 13574]RMA75301.1 DNA polymerase III catalytic subunit DnaE type [Petrotoga olearia]
MKILGPVVTSKTIGKSYLQLRDLFPLAKRYGYNCIVLSEPHPKSWVSFIVYAQKYGVKPIILYETVDGKFLLQTNNDIRSAVIYYNGLVSDLKLKKIDLNLPYVKYPTGVLKDIFNDEESLCIKDGLKYQNELSIFSNIETYYNIRNYKFDEYKVTDLNLTDIILQKELTSEEKKRLSYELNIIKKLNVENYILTVKKIVDTAIKNNILVGPGRGSAVGSFLVYKLGITKVNPIDYDLLFERFLNQYRHELPDIDLDVDAERRVDLIKALQKEFGENKISQIRTYSTMKIKSSLKKAEELLGYNLEAKINAPIRSKENIDKFKSLPQKDKTFFYVAYYLEGIEVAESVHAAGLIISQNDLRTFSPIEGKKTPQRGFKEVPIIEWEMSDLKYLGVEKFDILALDTLTFLKKLQIKEKYRELNDSKTFHYLSKGLTKGIFQLDSKLGQKLAQRIKPKNFEELILLLAINRPGPLESGMIDQYVNEDSPEYLKKIFPETMGVLVYQEQIMKIAQILGEFSPQESDLLRKAVSKKEKDKITTFKNKFVTNASKKIDEEEANVLFSQIENFAQYAFNKSHAVAYAHITYWLSEKKFQDPSNFFLEYVKIKGLDVDIIDEASLLGVKIKLPDIRYPSGLASKTDLILPLYIIKGIGKNISHIFEEAKLSNLEDFFNFVINKNINRNIVELIIKSGALDYFNNNRKNLLREVTQRVKGKVQQLEDIKSTLFGEVKQKSIKKVETTLQDYAQYEIESIGFPLSLMSQKGLSNTLINKYLYRQKVYLDGYVYRDFIVDNSAMIYSKVYNKNLKRLIKYI